MPNNYCYFQFHSERCELPPADDSFPWQQLEHYDKDFYFVKPILL